MEFGLWFEPEMVNLDSDVARAHPEWVLGPVAGAPLPSRHQHVLDLADPGRLRLRARGDERGDRPLRRRLRQVGPQPRPARGGAHRRVRHRPARRARPDPRHLPAARRAARPPPRPRDRVVLRAAAPGSTSGCSPAPTGSGPPTATTRSSGSPSSAGPACSCPRSGWARTSGRRGRTRRTATSTCRCGCSSPSAGTPGSSGTSRTCSPDELDALRAWSGLYRELRPLLHGGDVVRSDHPDDALLVSGVVAADRADAVFTVVAPVTGRGVTPGTVPLPGLDPERRYRVRVRPEAGLPATTAVAPPAWWDAAVGDGIVVSRSRPRHGGARPARARPGPGLPAAPRGRHRLTPGRVTHFPAWPPTPPS